MLVTSSNLTLLATAFKAAFAAGLGQAESKYQLIATVVPSTTGTEEYGWLGQFPGMREWLGDRVVHGMQAHGYSIRNKDFELTMAVPRNAIDDDTYGIYKPFAEQLGQSAKVHPDELVADQLANGHARLCYDGQNFFDTDHPVLDASGVAASQSNLDDNSGSGTRWFLLDCKRPLKPIVFQDRKKPAFVAMDTPTDEAVFMRKEFRYGVDSRCNVGYGFWQLAYCSRKTLDETNLVAAFTAMTERKGDYEKPLGIRPSRLVVPPSLEWTAKKLVNATTLANGEDNVMKGVVEVVVLEHLA